MTPFDMPFDIQVEMLDPLVAPKVFNGITDQHELFVWE